MYRMPARWFLACASILSACLVHADVGPTRAQRLDRGVDASTGIALARMRKATVDEIELQRGRSTLGPESDPLLVALAATGRSEEGDDCRRTEVLVLRTHGPQDSARVSILVTGCFDDVVDAKVTNVLLVRSGGTEPWTIAELREAWKCNRGRERGKWGISDCGN